MASDQLRANAVLIDFGEAPEFMRVRGEQLEPQHDDHLNNIYLGIAQFHAEVSKPLNFLYKIQVSGAVAFLVCARSYLGLARAEGVCLRGLRSRDCALEFESIASERLTRIYWLLLSSEVGEKNAPY